MSIKRIIDIVLAITMIVITLPIIVVASLLVRIFIGKEIIFRQERLGYKAKRFTIYKFKTMMDLYDKSGNVLPDKFRMTKIGNILRATSIDELPELFNIMLGDMSFVGPRPLLVEYLPLYNERQLARHNVKPGLTGLAQINGRNAISWEKKFELDLWYVENQSLWLDFKIIFLTIYKVLFRHGISAEGHETTEKFRGSGS